MQARQSIPVSALIAAAAVLIAACGCIALLVPAFYGKYVAELKLERGWSTTPAETVQTKSAQAARLKSYAWIDREKGVIALPIERAMELVVAESAGKNGAESKR